MNITINFIPYDMRKFFYIFLCLSVVLLIGGYKLKTKIKTYSSMYITSDLEGRFDLYLHFFMRIGLLDFNNSPEDIKNITNNLYQKIVVEKDAAFCKALTEKMTPEVISKAINKDFAGQIIINGDITSNRIGYIFNDNDDFPEIKDFDIVYEFNRCSVELLKTLKNKIKDQLIIVAGNHDVHDSDSVHDVYSYNRQIKSLDKIKKDALDNLSFYRFYKTLIKNKIFVFKHAAGTLNQHFEDILSKDPISIQHGFIPRDQTTEEKYFWLYFQDSKFGINETTERILEAHNVFLIHGHTHEKPDNKNDKEEMNLNKQLSQNRLCSDWHVHVSLLEGKKICYYHIDRGTGLITAKDFFSGKEYFSADPFNKQVIFK